MGNKLKIEINCSVFQKTLNKNYLPPNVERWALIIKEYEYEIEHIEVTRMEHVYALS